MMFTKAKDIFFVRMNHKGNFFWHYIAVKKSKAPLFAKIKNKNVELKEYGKLLDSGWGFFPPKEIREKYPDIKIS